MTAGCERVAFVLASVIALAGTVRAQSPNAAAAEAAFKEGRELFKAGKYAPACEQFARSHELDPANGTLFNLALCSERIGKLATAAAAYRELVAKDTNAERKATAAARLKDVARRVPKLVVSVADPPADLVVELDGSGDARTIVANRPVEVDLGEYTIVARAAGRADFTKRVNVSEEAKTTTVDATLVPDASTRGALASQPRMDLAPAPRSRRKVVGIVGMATGGAAIAGGTVVGWLARSAWSDAKAVCGGTTCTTQADVDRANQLGDQARSKATLATALTIGGAVIAGVGAYLFITAPGDTTITPTASESGAGVALSGTF